MNQTDSRGSYVDDSQSVPAGRLDESSGEDSITQLGSPRGDAVATVASTRPRVGIADLAGRVPWTYVALAAILVLSLMLRLYGVDWDQGGAFHPDERAVSSRVHELDFGQLLEPSTLFTPESRLNPRWFNYGSLYLYVVAGLEALSSPFVEQDWSIFDLQRNGRRVNAVFDTVTVLLVFLITRRLFSTPAALFASLLAALSVIAIQNAHYATVDSLTTTLIVGTVYWSVRYVDRGKLLDAALAGVFVGLAVATKFAAAPVAAAVLSAHVLRIWDPRRDNVTVRIEMSHLLRLIRGLLVSGIAGLVALAVAQPYMFIDFGTWVSDVFYQSRMVRRTIDLPYTRQYIDTAMVWYQVKQLSTYGLGIFLGVTVWVGLFWGVFRSLARLDRAAFVVLAFLLPYLALVLTFEVKFLRYMLPATPLLMVFAGGFIGWCGCKVLGVRGVALKLALGLFLAVLFIGTGHYAFAFTRVFDGPHPAHQVSDWLEANARPGSTVIQEHWEEGIPGRPGFIRVQDRLPFYEHESEQKWEKIISELAQSDYFVLYSNRLAATLPRLPDRYPITTRFYDSLFDGSLGYELRFTADRFPSSAGVMYRDDAYARVPIGYPSGIERSAGSLLSIDWYGWADESHTVYEHPQSMVFERTGEWDVDSIYESLEVGRLLAQLRQETLVPEVGLLMSPTERSAQESSGSWNAVYWLRGLPNELAWLVWLIAVQVIALATLPISYVIFRPLADRGYMFAKVLGLLLVSTIAWLLASYRLMDFSVWSVALALVAVAAVSGVLYWRKRAEMSAYFRANVRTIAVVEVLFLLAFIGFLLIRLGNPDLWHVWRGGEKPMDFAYLNAVSRSSLMPPYDPWYAGGYLNYYYYGQFIVATVIRLTGIVPTVAYNLAVPLMFALTVGAAYSLVYNLVAAAKRAMGTPRTGWSPVVFGVFGAVLVAVAANIDGLVQLAQLGWGTLVDDLPFWRFDYWRSSRMLEPGTGGNEITEFPFFAFLYADLHAHMIAIPFAMLALGLAIVAALRVGVAGSLRWEGIGTIVLLGVTVGSLRLINSWDFPTQLLLSVGLVALAEMFLGHAGFYRRVVAVATKSVAVFAVGYLVYLPFHANFELFSDGIELSRFQTPLWRYVLIHSLFLFAIFSWMFVEWRRGAFGIASLMRATGSVPGVTIWMPLGLGMVLGAIVVILGALLADYITAMLAVLGAGCLGVTAALAYSARHPAHRYIAIAAILAAAALLLTAAVDVVTVKNDIGRQNTIFKFYIQAWWLFAIAATFALWRMWDLGCFSLRRLRFGGTVWLVVLAMLVIGVLVYPVMATREKMSERFEHIGMGIDGEAYMDNAVYRRDGVEVELRHDKEGIEWLRSNVVGSPTIVEAAWHLYTWTQRVSIYTGLPTVIGWDWHQTQQRFDYSYDVARRRNDVIDFYSTRDASGALDFLERYGVQYVYVGELERQIYPESGIGKFDDMEHLGVRKVFESGEVSIYRYDG